MGLFDAFSRKDEQARKELLDLLVRQANEEKTRQRKELAVLDARYASAKDWLTANRDAIVMDYDSLLDAFFTREPEAVNKALRDIGDRAGIVARIPVYFGDGVTAVSFAEMAEKVFPATPSIAHKLRELPPGLPESAYVLRNASDYYRDERPMTPVVQDNPGLGGRLTGSHKEEQMKWINHFSQILDGLKKTGPEAVANKNAALAGLAEAHLIRTSAIAARHYALGAAFSQGDSAGVLNALRSAAEEGTIADIMALGTGDDEAADFTALTLKSFSDKIDIKRVCEALMVHGQKLEVSQFLAKSLADTDPLHPESLREAFNAAARTQGQSVLTRLATDFDEKGVPWLTRALGTEDVMQQLLQPLGDDLMRAGALLFAADHTPDAAAKEALRLRAEKLIGTEDFITLAPMMKLRVAAVDYAYFSSPKLKIALDGNLRQLDGTPERAAVAARVIGGLKDMIRVDSHHAINGTEVLNAWRRKNGQLGVITRQGSLHWNADSKTIDAILDNLAARPGFVRVGGEVVNALAVDNFWPAGKEGDLVKLAFVAKGKDFYISLAKDDVEPLMDTLMAANPGLVRAGKELFDAARVGNVWTEIEKPPVIDGKPVSDEVKHVIRFAVTRTLRAEIAPEEGAAILDTLVRHFGHIRVADNETVNPAAISYLSLVPANEGAGGKLAYGIDGRAYSTKFDDRGAIVKLIGAAVKGTNDLYVVNDELVINLHKTDRVSIVDNKLQHTVTGSTGSTTAYDSDATKILVRQHGFIPLDGTDIINPARVGEIFYSDGKLTLAMPEKDIDVKMDAGRAQKIIDEVTAAKRDDKRGMGTAAAPSLSVEFSQETAVTATAPQKTFSPRGPSL